MALTNLSRRPERRIYARYIPVDRGRSVIATAASIAPRKLTGHSQPRSGLPAHSRAGLQYGTQAAGCRPAEVFNTLTQ